MPMLLTCHELQCNILCRTDLGAVTAGPVTILNWSFPRKDITRQAQAFQLALAIREEVADLEKAGCKVIQVCVLPSLYLLSCSA